MNNKIHKNISDTINDFNWKNFKKTAGYYETFKINELTKENAYNCLSGITYSTVFATFVQLLYSDQSILPNNLIIKIILGLAAGSAVAASTHYGILIANNCKKIKKYKLERAKCYKKIISEYETSIKNNEDKIKINKKSTI